MNPRRRAMNGRISRGFAVAALGVLALSAGASAQPSSSAPASVRSSEDVETLRARAASFWAARVRGDVNAQYQVLEPRGKARTSPAEYGGAPGAVRYLAYQVEDATVKGFFATVKVRLVFQPILSTTTTRPTVVPPASVVVEDRWIRIQGVWYRVLEQE